MSCGVGHRHGSDLALLWLWHRLEATSRIRLLALESPYARGVAKKEKKNGLLRKINNKILSFVLLKQLSRCGCHLLIWRKLVGQNFLVIMDDQIVHFTYIRFCNAQ